MLTVDFERLRLVPGERLLDLGSGGGRHAFEAMRRGARVTALDYSAADLKDVAAVAGAMIEAGEASYDQWAGVVNADALDLPFPDNTLRPRDRLRGARAHLGRRARARRDRPRAAARRPRRGDGSRPAGPSASRGRSTDHYHDTPGAPRAHLPPARARAEARTRRLLPARLAPRARVPLAVLVAEVRVRARQPRRRAGEALPRVPLPPHRAQPALGARHRARAQPGARQEPRRVRREGRHRRRAKWGKRSLG